jgi:3'(2'), 5'-bisphosphate nucleotidase
MKYDLQDELELSKNLALEAGKEVLKVYNVNFQVEYKSDNSPLTLADKISNELIVTNLKKHFPLYSILSEESEDDKERLKNSWCWIIDPLDGTKEFIKKNGEFTINVALSHKNKAVLGVVYIPVTGELFFASKENGAYLSSGDKTERIHVSDKTKDLILAKSRSHFSEKMENLILDNKNKISTTISSGSSIKGCLVASGKADLYYRFNPTMEWDTAAVQIIAEEAGGIFRQLDDSEMTYNRENSLNEKGFYILNKIENKLYL